MSRDALVVGINQYQVLPTLRAAAVDAEAIAQRLSQNGEFRVQRLPEIIVPAGASVNGDNAGTSVKTTAQAQVGQRTGVSTSQLEAALVKLFKPSGPHVPETALFYFSGHGLQKSSGIHEGYLATSEANPHQSFFGLSLFWLRRLLQESPVRQRVIWLDCCHSGALLDVAEVDPGAKPGTSRFLMAASREYESAYESLDSQYSVLTEAILEGLEPGRVDSGIITNHSLTDWVNTRLKGQLQQPLFENSGAEIWLTRGTGRPVSGDVGAEAEGPGEAIAKSPNLKYSNTNSAHANGAHANGSHANHPNLGSPAPGAEAEVIPSATKGKAVAPSLTEPTPEQVKEPLKQQARLPSPSPAVASSSNSALPDVASPGSAPPGLAPPSPFPGLQAFRSNQAYAFTGRTKTIKMLLRAVYGTPLVSLVGGASSGKTSLVQAGLLPALTRFSQKSGKPWLIKQVQAGQHKQPLLDLAEAFVDASATEWERGEQLRRNSLLLASDTRGLVQLVHHARASHQRNADEDAVGEGIENARDRHPSDRKSIRLLLVVDAFELLLQASSDPDMGMIRQHFLSNLVTLMQEDSDWVRLLLVVRSDYWDACYKATELLQQGPSRLVGIDPLEGDAMAEAMTQPLQRVGWQCEAHLPAILLGDIAPSPSRLALMQLVLKSLWDHPASQSDRTLRLCTYAELGGIRGLLVGQATQLLETLTASEQKLVQRIFLALTQLGDGAPDSLRTISKADLGIGSTPTPSSDELIAVLETLIESRLVYSTGYSVQLPPEEDLDLAFLPNLMPRESLQASHEALIRDWPALQDWLKAERPRLVRQRRIEFAAKDWCDRNEMFAKDGWLQGRNLREAEAYLREHPDDLSSIAQHYIHLSHKQHKKRRKDSKLLQFGLPTALTATLFALVYHAFITRSFDQTEQIKAMQAQNTTKQILSDPDADPTTALLLNRLALANGSRSRGKGEAGDAERSHSGTIALHGLREALRSLQVRGQFKGRSGMEQIHWSQDQQTLVGVNHRGHAYLWRVAPILAREDSLRLQQRLSWPQPAVPQSALMRSLMHSTADVEPSAPAMDPRIRSLSLSADSRQVAAIAQDKKEVVIWSLQSGKVMHHLKDFPIAPEQIQFSPASQHTSNESTDPRSNDDGAKGRQQPQPLLAIVAGRTVHLWGTDQEPKAYGTLEHLAPVEEIAFSQEGQYLLTSAGDRRLRLWNLNTGIQEQEITASTPLEQIRLSPSGKMIAALGRNGTLYVWDRRSGDRLQVLKVVERFAQAKPQQMVFSEDETTLVSVQGDRVWVWDVATGDLQNMLQLSDQEVVQAEAAPSPSTPTQVIPNQATQTQSTPTQVTPTQPTQKAPALSPGLPPLVRLSPDGALLLAVDQGKSGASHLWNLRTGEKLRVLRDSHASAVRDARFNPDGSTLVTVRESGQLTFWDSEPGYEMPPIHVMEAPQAQGFAQASAAEVALSQANPLRWLNLKPRQNLRVQPRPSGLDFLLLDEAGQLRRWDLATGLPETSHYLNHPDDSPITAADWTPTLSHAITAHRDGAVQLWSLGRGNSAAIQIDDLADELADKSIVSLQLSHHAQTLLAVDARRQIYLWDVSGSGKNPQRFLWPQAIGSVEQAQMSRDGKRLVTASGGRLALWNIKNGEQLRRFDLPGVTAIALDEAGKTLAVALPEGSIKLLSIQTGKVLLTLPSLDHRVIKSLTFSGDQLAAGTMDGQITLWDRTRGDRLSQLQHPSLQQDFRSSASVQAAPGAILDLSYSPDGQVISAIDSEGTVAFWAATEKSLRKLARDRSFRQLTSEECVAYLKLTEADCPRLPGAQTEDDAP